MGAQKKFSLSLVLIKSNKTYCMLVLTKGGERTKYNWCYRTSIHCAVEFQSSLSLQSEWEFDYILLSVCLSSLQCSSLCKYKIGCAAVMYCEMKLFYQLFCLTLWFLQSATLLCNSSMYVKMNLFYLDFEISSYNQIFDVELNLCLSHR